MSGRHLQPVRQFLVSRVVALGTRIHTPVISQAIWIRLRRVYPTLSLCGPRIYLKWWAVEMDRLVHVTTLLA